MHDVRPGQGWAGKAWKRPVADWPGPNEIPREEAIQETLLSGRVFNVVERLPLVN
jgi:hypothetical protein